MAAGISRMNYGRYLAFDIPGIVVWSVSLLVLGYYSPIQPQNNTTSQPCGRCPNPCLG